MPIVNVRQGTAVRIAAKFQSGVGVPIEYIEWVDGDVLRVDDGSFNPNVETISQTGLTGGPYEQAEGVALVGIEPTVDLTVKASRQTVALFLKSLLGKDPAAVAGYKTFEGFEFAIPYFLSVIYDSTYEAFRIPDVWFHTIEFNSRQSENLVMAVTGRGRDWNNLTPQLLDAQFLENFDTYSHKASLIEDVIGGTPLEIWASEQTLRIEHGFISQRGNSVAPNFVGKDGRITITGTISTRLSDETAPWFARMLDPEGSKSDITYRYVQQDGKILELIIRNATLRTQPPTLNADGTMNDLEVEFTAHQEGESEFPITVRIQQ